MILISLDTLDLYASEVPYITNNIIAYNYGFFDYANLSDAEKKIADVQKNISNN